jgi:diguanylate cyclase (GGDEF)-like protein
VILVQSDKAAALRVAERICAAVRGHPVRIESEVALTVTLSAGVASLPHDVSTAAALVAAADKALYAAKTAGRDRVVVIAAEGRP